MVSQLLGYVPQHEVTTLVCPHGHAVTVEWLEAEDGDHVTIQTPCEPCQSNGFDWEYKLSSSGETVLEVWVNL